MQANTHMGLNKTGAKMSPVDVSNMEEFADLNPVTDSLESIETMRAEAIAEADSVGSVPVPGTFRGMVETGMSMMKGDKPAVLIDKLGERLAFERTGTRLYEALITKCLQLMPAQDQRLLALTRIHSQEVEHFQMLKASLESLGADPTAQTPCADVTAVMSSGIMQVVTDPRTNLAQSLNAMLVAELADNASWELLLKLVTQAGHDTLAEGFRKALEQEQEHLLIVKQMLEDAVMVDAT
ncbi:MAG: ferritin-like domain-containing protein [Rubrivivax sp.]|nr:MAG: ferritin-like domain-containing protein [Rubrivivax sp.]